MSSFGLAYSDAGSGPALVLLHAFPFDRRFWQTVSPAFVQAGFRVIAPDLRGFGESHASDTPWSLVDQAADVVTLLDRLQVPQAHVLGLSMGGYVALALAATHPLRLRSLVLAHTKAAPDSEQAAAGREQAIKTVQSAGVNTFVDGMLPKLLSPRASQAAKSLTRELMNQPANTIIAAQNALRLRPDRQPELPRIAVPTLVLTGSEDGISTPTENQAMAARIANAKLEVIEGVGHLSNLEAPNTFASLVTAFLRATSG